MTAWSRKKKGIIAIAAFLLAAALVKFLGVGYAPSGAAIRDLKEELQVIYGAEYSGKEIGGETEDMTFVIRPKTRFLTNWNIRQALGLDYEYECSVIFTRYANGAPVQTRTIRYRGVDPMGKSHSADRAYIKMDSKVEIDPN